MEVEVDMISPYYWNNYRVKVMLKLVNRIWWRLMPGTIIKVSWPAGNIVVDYNHPRWQDIDRAAWVDLGFSADPNDHYRPWMEKEVGRQGWDWDWTMTDNDVTENRLTIKFRKGKEKYAAMFALRWA